MVLNLVGEIRHPLGPSRHQRARLRDHRLHVERDETPMQELRNAMAQPGRQVRGLARYTFWGF